MRVAVASGKGGTGKTIVSTSLAWLLARHGQRVCYVDADVEEPNGHLLLRPAIANRERHAVAVPALRGERCSGCGECQHACAYHAILALPDRVMVLPELCHSCGGCQLACPDHALDEAPLEIGTIESGGAGVGGRLRFRAATLDVGQARATPLIKGLLAELPPSELVVVDSPPGTSCSAMEAIASADRVILVTEPTPFGLHDLQLAVEMSRALEQTPQVILNRADLGDDRVQRYLAAEGIELCAEIPFSQEVAVVYARGRIAAEQNEAFRKRLEPVARQLVAEATS